MKPEVEIYDTTLRDGSQGEGINFSVMDKLRIAERLDQFGIHFIEGGWPGSNPKDIEFFEQAKRRKFKHAKLAAFGATRRKGVAVEDDEQVRLLLAADASLPLGEARPFDATSRGRTVGEGAVALVLKRLPDAGDSFTEQSWHFEVIEMEGRRIERLRVSPVESVQEEG